MCLAGGYTKGVAVDAKDLFMKTSQSTASHLVPGRISPARLMSPAEVMESTLGYRAVVREAVTGRWALCGDAGPVMFRTLSGGRTKVAEDFVCVRWNDNETYLVISHRISRSLHRFMLPLHSPVTQAFIQDCKLKQPMISLGNAGGGDAVLFIAQFSDELTTTTIDAVSELAEGGSKQVAGSAPGLLEYRSFVAPTQDPELEEIALSVWAPPTKRETCGMHH